MVKIIVASLLLAVLSCSVDNTYLGDDFFAQPVLNGYIEPDRVSVSLRLSQPIQSDGSSNKTKGVPGALVEIYDAGSDQLIGVLDRTEREGVYSATPTLTPGQSYYITASSSVTGDLRTQPILLPMPVTGADFSVEDFVVKSSQFSSDRRLEVTGNLSVAKPTVVATDDLAFMIEVFGIAEDTIIDFRERDDFEAEFAIACGIVADVAIVFTPLCFTEDTVTFPFVASGIIYSDIEELEVRFYTITPDFHNYALVETQGSDGFEAIFTQPEPSISNVLGGLGYVAGRSGLSVSKQL